MRCLLLPLIFSACGSAVPQASANIAIPFPLSRADCPTLANDPPIQAKLIIEGVEAPCALTVSKGADGTFTTTGSCPNIALNADKTQDRKRILTLRWYLNSPKVGKEIVIAESIGSVDLSAVSKDSVKINFDDSTAIELKPKTKAVQAETATEKDRFNCDRGGQFGPGDTPCDSVKTLTQAPGADKDNCSNLEELCKGTLFSAVDNTDCN